MFDKDNEIISIPGPVQAGKTEKFISIMEDELANGKICLALKFDFDIRFTTDAKIQSHNGKVLSNTTNRNMHVLIISRNTISLALAGKSNDFLAKLDGFDVVGIDESQFVDGDNENVLIDFAIWLRSKGKKVIFAGLDYWGVKPGSGLNAPIVASVAAFNKSMLYYISYMFIWFTDYIYSFRSWESVPY